ncbi:MAG: Cof-type HAD-IIB family hydrolase [Lachnospirales bacterium]
MKKYKLVVLDIDGTTVKSNGQLSEYTINTIRRTVNEGVPVCLCTGRNLKNTKPILKKLKIKTPIICIDGAVMYDPVDKKILREHFINMDIIKEITKIVDEFDVYMEFCTLNNYIKYLKYKGLEKYSYGGVPQNTLDATKFFLNGVRIVKDLEKIYNIKNNINQFLIGGKSEDIKKVMDILKNKNYKNIIFRDDLWDNYILIAHSEAIKSEGVNLLCQHYNIDIDETIAMGDQMNDIDMIKKVGFGIAMGNAHDKIKEVAKHITVSNDEDGVAKAIEEFVLKK